MGVYKNEKNGTWYYKSHYKDIDGKFRYVTKRGFKTKADAKKAEADFVLNKKNYLEYSNIRTFGELYNEYYEYQKSRVKESTLITTDNKIKNHVLPYFENKKLQSLTTKDIDDWHNLMLNHENDYSIVYLQGLHSKFGSVIQYGVRKGYIKSNVVELQGNFVKCSEDIEEMKYYTFDEWQKFEEQLDDNIYKLLFQFLYYTGARVGEALALSFNDFNADFTMVSINKTITSKTKEVGVIVTPTKTKSSIRKISVPDVLAEKLRSYYISCQNYSGFKKSDFVFGITKPLSTTTLERKNLKASKAAGLEKIRIHDLRHSHASFLINNGVAPLAISKRLGHKSLSTTLDVYVHMFDELEKDAINLINKKLNDSAE